MKGKQAKLLVFGAIGHVHLSHTSGSIDFLALQRTRLLECYRFMIKLKLQISLKTCVMKGFLQMQDLHALRTTFIFLFPAALSNDPILEHSMVLSFEMAVNE